MEKNDDYTISYERSVVGKWQYVVKNSQGARMGSSPTKHGAEEIIQWFVEKKKQDKQNKA